MTWTYTNNPINVPRDAARLFVGDTVPTAALLQDEEFDYFLLEASNKPIQAAILACEALATRYAQQVDVTVGKLSIANSQRSQAFDERALALRKRLGLAGVRIIVGGRSWSERATARSNSDALQPAFEIGESDYHSLWGASDSNLVWGRWA